MSQAEKAREFAALHVKGDPLILYNAWDVGSARTIVDAGARAIATSSWAVATAQGYDDGEDLPLAMAEQVAGKIASSVVVPVTIDFEGGYSEDDDQLFNNVTRLMGLGVIGINFEDRVVKGNGLYSIEQQARRIGVIRSAAEKRGVELFINARTDVFLGNGDSVEEALLREKAYAAAGASGFFVPGLTDAGQINQIASASTLPINVMMMDGLPPKGVLAQLGVARVSYGPLPLVDAMAALRIKTIEALS